MNPIRTCVSCRTKHDQKVLVRLQCIKGQLSLFSGFGRSFYLCHSCIKDNKNINRALSRQCKNNKKYDIDLKEIVVDVR